MSRLFVRSGGAIIPVAVDDVAWFEAQGDYVTAHVGADAARAAPVACSSSRRGSTRSGSCASIARTS